jgi:hypothetical protein
LNERQITALLKVTCQRPKEREEDILQVWLRPCRNLELAFFGACFCLAKMMGNSPSVVVTCILTIWGIFGLVPKRSENVVLGWVSCRQFATMHTIRIHMHRNLGFTSVPS